MSLGGCFPTETLGFDKVSSSRSPSTSATVGTAGSVRIAFGSDPGCARRWW